MKDSQRIVLAGNTKAVSEAVGESMGVVTNWKRRGIPRGWRLLLATKFPEIDWAVTAAEGSEGQGVPPAAAVESVKVAA